MSFADWKLNPQGNMGYSDLPTPSSHSDSPVPISEDPRCVLLKANGTVLTNPLIWLLAIVVFDLRYPSPPPPCPILLWFLLQIEFTAERKYAGADRQTLSDG